MPPKIAPELIRKLQPKLRMIADGDTDGQRRARRAMRGAVGRQTGPAQEGSAAARQPRPRRFPSTNDEETEDAAAQDDHAAMS